MRIEQAQRAGARVARIVLALLSAASAMTPAAVSAQQTAQTGAYAANANQSVLFTFVRRRSSALAAGAARGVDADDSCAYLKTRQDLRNNRRL